MHGLVESADLLAAAKQLVDGSPSLLAVVLGQLVHVHAHEAVGELVVEAPSPLRRVLERALAVVEPGADRIGEDRRKLPQNLRAEIAPGHVRAERQREARVGQPPLAEVEHLV